MSDASAVIALYIFGSLWFEWKDYLWELSATFYLCSFHMLSSLMLLPLDFSSVVRSQILGPFILLLYIYIFFPAHKPIGFFLLSVLTLFSYVSFPVLPPAFFYHFFFLDAENFMGQRNKLFFCFC